MPYGEYSDISTLTVITASLASSVVLNSNPNRQGMILYNGSTQPVYVKLGGSTSVTSGSMSLVLAPSGSYEDNRTAPFIGNVRVVWSSAAVGTLFITEFSK